MKHPTAQEARELRADRLADSDWHIDRVAELIRGRAPCSDYLRYGGDMSSDTKKKVVKYYQELGYNVSVEGSVVVISWGW